MPRDETSALLQKRSENVELSQVFEGAGLGLAVQLTTWSLVVGGLLCTGAVITTAGKSSHLAFPCVLSAVVCFVAAFHYMILERVRSSSLSGSMLKTIAKMTNLSNSQLEKAEKLVLARENNNDVQIMIKKELNKKQASYIVAVARFNEYQKERDNIMEYVGDAVRFSDWLFTLPLLTLELHMMGTPYLKPEGRPLDLDMWDVAALSIGTVLAGAVFRLFLDNPKTENKVPRGLLVAVGFVLLWCGASVMFALVCLQLTGGLREQETAGSVAAHDITAIMIFQLVQVGYPVVSAGDWIARFFLNSDDARLRSAVKDGCYGALDAVSKSAFSIYVAFRITWYQGTSP